MTIISRLNPFASEFVPYSAQNVASAEFHHIAPSGQSVASLSRLPDDVVSVVLCYMDVPQDVIRLSCCCRRLETLASLAPLCLSVTKALAHADEQDVVARHYKIRAVLRSICRRLRGTYEMDLSATAVEDEDVLEVLSQLPSLRLLRLSSCRKLSSQLTALLRAAPQRWALRVLSLQRCFQMDNTTLSNIIFPSDALQLDCVLLSHLQLRDWPTQVPVMSADMGGPCSLLSSGLTKHLPQPSLGSSLQVLGLLNCAYLSIEGLRLICQVCCNLRYLLLGGSHVHIQLLDGAADAELARWQAAVPAEVLQEGPRWVELVVQLGMLAASLPHLQALELTFFPAAACRAVASLLANAKLVGRSVSVWSFVNRHSLGAVLQLLREVGSGGRLSTNAGDRLGPGLKLAAQAVANCSCVTRHTPLHIAASDDSVERVRALIELGASLDMRDRGGNTPLLIACDTGHCEVAGELLLRGAEYAVKNNAGESPLYLAALKGHGAVVAVLLEHCRWHGVCWHSPELYSEGWTPLMAAVVGSHQAVVQQLLRAAEFDAPQLVAAANRNGQTALHVAAQIGSVPLLRILLGAGGERARGARDNNGRTAQQIAERIGNVEAAALLCCRAQARAQSREPRLASARQYPRY